MLIFKSCTISHVLKRLFGTIGVAVSYPISNPSSKLDPRELESTNYFSATSSSLLRYFMEIERKSGSAPAGPQRTKYKILGINRRRIQENMNGEAPSFHESDTRVRFLLYKCIY
jgi:hypothetical protein